MKQHHHMPPYTTVNSEWMKDIEVRPETINTHRKSNKRTLYDTCSGNVFDILNPTARKTKGKNQTTVLSLKIFCTTKVSITKTDLVLKGKIFTCHMSDRGLVTRICKGLRKLIKEKNSSTKKIMVETKN